MFTDFSLKQTIKEWDSKSENDITAIYFDYYETPNFTTIIINLIENTETQNAATWLLKKHLEEDVTLTTVQVNQIYDSLSKLNHWESKLHILQSMPYLPIAAKQKNAVESFLRTCLTSKNKFVRAWTYNGFNELARQHPEYQSEVDVMLAEAMQKEVVSVKARIRNILKQFKK